MVLGGLLLAGCTALRARNHACYPYLEHVFQGQVPPAVMKELAQERDTTKTMKGQQMAIGYYWRKQQSLADGSSASRKRRPVYERAECPGRKLAQALSTRPPSDEPIRLLDQD